MPAKEIRDQRNESEDEEQPEVVLNPLLLDLDEEKQKSLVSIVMEDYRNATEARNKTDWGRGTDGSGLSFDAKYAQLAELYEGRDDTRPEKWMCGRSLKIAQAVVEMLVARLVPAIWNESAHRWRPTDHVDKHRVDQVNKIMHWVLNVWMRIGEVFVPRLVRQAVMYGSAIAETKWKVTKRDLDETEVIEVKGPDGNVMIDGDGLPMTIEEKLLRIDERPCVEIVPITRFLTQPGQTDIHEEPVIKYEDFYYHELEQMQKEGLAQNITDKLKTAVNKTISDDLGELLEDAERIRDFDAKRRSHVVEALIWYGPYDCDEDGFAEEVCVMVSLKEELFLRAFKTSKVSRRGKRPFNFVPFLERLHKLFGIGLLEQVEPLAREIDAVFRQLQDANTLSIMRWGFYDPNSDYDPGEHVAKPRAMYPVTNPSQNVYFPDLNIPIDRLVNAIHMIMQFVERLTAASSSLMGKEAEFAGGPGTATRTQAIVSSASVRFNMPAANIRVGLSQVLTDIFDLCFLNMPEGLERRITGEDGEKIFDSADEIADAFVQEFDAYLLPNASFGDPATERELAAFIYDKFVMGGNPLIAGDPARLWMASANVFKAYGQEPKEWLGEPPTKKVTNDPVEEHTLFRQGEYVPIEPQENHLEHIMVHQRFFKELEASTDALLWPSEALQALRLHIEDHARAMAQLQQFQQQGGPNGGTPVPGKAPAAKGGTPAAPGQFGVSSSASPSRTSPSNQVQGAAAGGANGQQQ
jgi:hypothetical protein